MFSLAKTRLTLSSRSSSHIFIKSKPIISSWRARSSVRRLWWRPSPRWPAPTRSTPSPPMMPPLSRPSRYPWSHLFLCSKSPAALRPPALIKKQTEPLSRPAGVLLRMVRDGAQVAHCLVQRHKTKPPTCSGISGKAMTQWELVHYSK